ncbi:phosphopantetheine-binding protein [bacterium]|uniref:phosphopantetheine-binding protein n=1 Tax=Lachnospiraceae TaxID=186803 RepID=UPI002A288A22|nr:phosphopantetheine-binding protein [bacterium]MDY2886323.1 phosphopantetheine-binding protein [Bariatricus sp.]MDY4769441.1 phosphopantetheine-binding protein [Lachnospiraceae bacterium]MCI7148946.1 phosphopantetheine-binding protein [bacterium]MDD6514042.1 phosphopantetheine-binding protein [bacterium]
MEKLLDILMEIDDSIDWKAQKALVNDRLLDSFAVISLIAELEEQFDIEIEAAEIIPENLNSVDAIWKMIQRLKEN